MRSPSSPSGTRSASRTSTRCASGCGRRLYSMAATSILLSRCVRSASPISPLAGKPRTVLVTGGAGYIRSHAAKALSRAGYQVVVFDNLVAGHREAVKYGELVVGDITDVAAAGGALGGNEDGARTHRAAQLDV